jgi:hypothetical protein
MSEAFGTPKFASNGSNAENPTDGLPLDRFSGWR